MARILIRPEDLARLARRFDAAADELSRSRRRLSHSRHEIRFNPLDESFPAAAFAQRSGLVEANLQRLAAEFQVDAGLMARTADDAEFDGEFGGEGRWTAGLTPGLGGSGGAAPVTAAPIGGWSSVAAGLVALGSNSSSSPGAGPTGARSTGARSARAGGLFRISSTGAGHELLDRLTERLGRSSRFGPAGPVDSSGESAAGAVWKRIVGELFAVEDDP